MILNRLVVTKELFIQGYFDSFAQAEQRVASANINKKNLPIVRFCRNLRARFPDQKPVAKERPLGVP